jgi:predicted nucleic acid-binding protein
VNVLLDSNPIIYYLNRQLPPTGRALLDQAAADGAAYSAITRLEVLGYPMDASDRARAQRMLALFLQLPLDDAVIGRAIKLRSNVRIKTVDALIAATAMIRDLPLITHNIRDFQAIAGLRLIDPFHP